MGSGPLASLLRRLTGVFGVAAVIAIVGVALTGSRVTGQASSDVAVAFQNDPAHSGSQSSDPLTPSLTKKWSVDLQSGVVSYPVIAQGLVFVTAGSTALNLGNSSGTNLYALDQATGNTVWGPVALGGQYAFSALAYENGVLFTINGSGVVRSFNASTGLPGWSLDLTRVPGHDIYEFTSPLTALNGLVYTAGSGVGGAIFAINETSGQVVWSQPVQEGQDSDPAVSSSGVYVSYPGEVYDFNPSTGAVIWHYSAGYGGGGTTPVLYNGRLYVRGEGGYGDTIFDAKTGTQLGSFNGDVPPAFDGSRGFFETQGTLEARDLANNDALLWSFAGDGALDSAPVAVNGYVYVGSNEPATNVGLLYALEESSGRVVWSDQVGAGVLKPNERDASTPMTGMGIANGLLVVPASSRVVTYTSSGDPPPPPPSPAQPPVPSGPAATAYEVDNLHDGAQASDSLAPPLAKRWSLNLGAMVTYPIIAQGMAYVAAGNRFFALDLRNGQTVWGPVTTAISSELWEGATYDQGRVFAQQSAGVLSAFDAGTGNLVWSRKLPAQFYFSSAPTARNGIVYSAGSETGGTVYALSEANGALLWTQSVMNGDFSSPVVTDTGVYVSYACQETYDLDPVTGAVIWWHQTSCEGGGGQTPVLHGTRLYVRDNVLGNVILDTATGNAVGTFSATPPPAFDGTLGFFLSAGS
ncbi:MAG: hypothetical protein E6I88_13880, partial [Chloroflexi bacterium]